jgi:hypothetical protein
MKIILFNARRSEIFNFENEVEFKDFREMLKACVIDSTNTKSVTYVKDGVEKIYPSLFIKSSLIEIVEKEVKGFVF